METVQHFKFNKKHKHDSVLWFTFSNNGGKGSHEGDEGESEGEEEQNFPPLTISFFSHRNTLQMPL